MDFSLLFQHPNSKEIINDLLSGKTPDEVYNWLCAKYSSDDNKHLLLTKKILKDFLNSDYINFYEQFKQDLTVVQNNKNNLSNISSQNVSKALQNNKTYRQRLMQIADQELDIKNMLKSLILVCRERAEQIFDKIQEDPHSFKGDHLLIKYFTELFNMVEKFERIVNNAPDKIIQHNISLQTIENNTNAILDAIRKTLSKIDTETSLLFMDLFYNELSNLSPPETDNTLSQEQRLKEVQLLEEKILS